MAHIKENNKVLLFALGIALSVGVFLLPIPSLAHEAHVVLSLLVFVIMLWVFEVFPLGVSAILFATLCVVFLLHSDEPITPAIAFSGFTNSNFWLMVGAFLIGIATTKTNLAKRIVLMCMAKAGTSYRKLTLLIWVSSLVIGLLTPSGTARMAIFIPIMVGIVTAYEVPEGSKLRENLFMHVFLSGACASLLWYTGTPMNAIAMGGLEEITGFHVTFYTWFAWMIVPAIFFFIGNYFIIEKLAPPEKELFDARGDNGFARNQLEKLGKLTLGEKKTGMAFIVMVALWMTESLHGISAAWIAMIVSIVLYLPGIGVLDKHDLASLPWDVLLLLGVALGLDGIISKTGLTDYIIEVLVNPILGPSVDLGPVAMVLAIVLIVAIMHFFLAGGIAETSAMTPIIVGFVVASGGNGILAAIAVARTAQDCVLFPFQSLPANVLYGTGYMSMRRFLILSGTASAFNCLIWNVAMVPYWEWITAFVV